MEYGNKSVFFVLLFLLGTWGSGGLITSGFAEEVKLPNVAGSFYPDNPVELSAMIDKFLEAANPKAIEGDRPEGYGLASDGQSHIFAIISPHAGYGYSGQTAAYGYKLIKGKPYKTVVVIGPAHYYGFNGASVYTQGVFRTPLGDLEIDSDFAQKLLNKEKEIFFQPAAFGKEHSVEVQLPFLQKTLSGFKIVPIVMGDCTLLICQKLANLLKEAIGERKDVLVVASTDMYHGYDYDEAETVDSLTLSYVKNIDAEGLYYGLREGKLQFCGGFGVVSTLILAKSLGYQKAEVLAQTNSAVVMGNKTKGTWTVGYTSCAIDGLTALTINPEQVQLKAERVKRIDQEKNEEEAMLSKAQRKRLLALARNSIETYLKTGKTMNVSETDPVLLQTMGAFVTLRENGELRGCIGNIIGQESLYLTVRDMAIEAATGDPRFPSVQLSELKNIEIEISALSPLEKVDSVEKIKLGVHGVVVKKEFNSGVFLPQVAEETGWSKEEFLSNLCSHKAGLPADAWKDKTTEIYVFSAEVFSENNTN